MDSYIASLASSLAMQETYMQVAMSVLKKTNDIAKTEGQLLVQLMESIPQANRLLDAYA
ncbi:MAG: YjfB family protein [Acidobacteriota bacterium]|jgi:hypothetical protein|nr:YjfB family protein [Acidobacteriota bacterium]